jgi:hypothetical protein
VACPWAKATPGGIMGRQLEFFFRIGKETKGSGCSVLLLGSDLGLSLPSRLSFAPIDHVLV